MEDNNIKVSIIIPCYNDVLYIRQCLESVVNQRRMTDKIEVIVVNDGSTDDSIKIINEFCNSFNYIKVINQNNSGQSVARNTGLEVAVGEYIYFLDSDDYLNLDAMFLCYQKVMETNADIVTFDTKSFVDYGCNCTLQNYIRSLKNNVVFSGSDMFSYMIKNSEFYPPVWLYFYSKDFIKNNSLSFIPGIIYEDTPFSVKAINSAERIVYISQKLHYRRVRKGSTMRSSITARNIYSNTKVIQCLLDFYRTVGRNLNSKKEQMKFIRQCSSWSVATIIKASDAKHNKTKEIKRFIYTILSYPKCLSFHMLFDALKGVYFRLKNR